MCSYCSPEDCTSFSKRFVSTSLIRILLITGYFGRIPLLKKIPESLAAKAKERSGVPNALPYEKMIEAVNNQKRGYVFFANETPVKCRCRSAGFHRKRDTDVVCVDYGHIVEIVPLVKKGGIRLLHKEEVLDIIEEAKEKHMVHTVVTYKHHDMYSVCSCCGCCCIAIVPYRQRVYGTCETNGMVAVTDEELCNGCGACVDHCKGFFNVRKLESNNGQMVANANDHCAGCGTCRDICPTGAISLECLEEKAVGWLEA